MMDASERFMFLFHYANAATRTFNFLRKLVGFLEARIDQAMQRERLAEGYKHHHLGCSWCPMVDN